MSKEYTYETAAWHILEAARQLRGVYSVNRFDEGEPEGDWILARVKSLQKLADKLSPPKETKNAKILQFAPLPK